MQEVSILVIIDTLHDNSCVYNTFRGRGHLGGGGGAWGGAWGGTL